MLVDITLQVTPNMLAKAQGNEQMARMGHIGTHFDVMNKTFPLEYTERKGLVFDVSGIAGQDIECQHIKMAMIEPDMFIAFYTGFIEQEGYGSKKYFTEHPQLSRELIEALLKKKISIIGVDFAGLRRGAEHTPMDQHCADNHVFVIENLCNLQSILLSKPYARFTANTYPMHYTDMTGLPCRVIARV